MSVLARRFAAATAAATFVLLLVGGLVNPTGSSLACPDWPLCHGTAFPAMTGGVLFEHSHRLVATGVGLLTVILAVLLWRDGRRGLGLVALGMVVAQGVLGGLTVLLKLPPEISLAHLALSMAFFTFLLYLAAGAERRAQPRIVSRGAYRLVLIAGVAIYLQILLGGLVRHTHSAYACVTEIPLCFGQLWPDAPQAQIHMAHRLFAVVSGVLAIVAALRAGRRTWLFWAIPAAVVGQIVLGLYTVVTLKALPIVEAHLAVGALLLALMARLSFTTRSATAPATAHALAAEGAR